MPGGTWSYPKEWNDQENLTNKDLNAQFQAVLENFNPEGIDDYSTDVAQMQLQTSPGDLGSESLPVSLAGELERIRYQIAAIIGQTYWYQKPAASLSADKPSVILSQPFKGVSEVDTWMESISRGNILNARLLDGYDNDYISDLQSTNKKFGDFPPVLSGNPIFSFSGKSSPRNKESLSMWMRNYPLDHYLAFNIQKGIYLKLNTFGRLESYVQLPQSQTENSKQVLSNIHTDVISGQSGWTNIIIQMRQGNVDGAGNDRLSSFVDNDDEQSVGSNFSTNQGDGGSWFFGCDKKDPLWDKFSAMSVLPQMESSDPWTFTGTLGQVSVSGGVLTIDSSGTQDSYFTKTTAIDLSSQTIELKGKFSSINPVISQVDGTPFAIQVRDDSMNRSCSINFYSDRIVVVNSLAAGGKWKTIFIDNTQWHVYRFVFSGATDPVLKVFVDGVHVDSVIIDVVDATALDLIGFGDFYSGSSQSGQSLIEWFAYADTAQNPVVSLGNNAPLGVDCNIDDLLVVQDYLSESSRGALQVYAARIALGVDLTKKDFFLSKKGSFMLPAATGDFVTASPTLVPVNTNDEENKYFVSDGIHEITIKASCQIENANAANQNVLYLSIQRLFSTDSFSTMSLNELFFVNAPVGYNIGTASRLSLEKKFILSPGVYYIKPYISSPGSTNASLKNSTVQIDVSHD